MGNYLASFFSPEAGQARRAWLDEQTNALMYYVPPELRPMLAQAYSMTPVASYEDSVRASGQMMNGNATPGQRWQAAGDMAAGVLGIVAPMAIAGRAGAPLADAVTEGLMNYSAGPRNALSEFARSEDGGLRLWHGSPHDFDQFDMSKIGTGEGAQAYGHGLYFAENKEVAENYKNSITRNSDELRKIVEDVSGLSGDAAEMLSYQFSMNNFHGKGFEKWLGGLKEAIDNGLINGRAKAAAEQIIARETEASDAVRIMKTPGRLYEVNVDANPEDFLNWDAPYEKQPAIVQAAIADQWKMLGGTTDGRTLPPFAARQDAPMESILASMSTSQPSHAAGVAESKLREAGIPGIRYLDAGSRGAGDGSRNYVVFDDSLITILKKYLVPGAAVSGAIAATPNDGRSQMQYDGQGNALYMLPPRG